MSINYNTLYNLNDATFDDLLKKCIEAQKRLFSFFNVVTVYKGELTSKQIQEGLKRIALNKILISEDQISIENKKLGGLGFDTKAFNKLSNTFHQNGGDTDITINKKQIKDKDLAKIASKYRKFSEKDLLYINNQVGAYGQNLKDLKGIRDIKNKYTRDKLTDMYSSVSKPTWNKMLYDLNISGSKKVPNFTNEEWRSNQQSDTPINKRVDVGLVSHYLGNVLRKYKKSNFDSRAKATTYMLAMISLIKVFYAKAEITQSWVDSGYNYHEEIITNSSEIKEKTKLIITFNEESNYIRPEGASLFLDTNETNQIKIEISPDDLSKVLVDLQNVLDQVY